MPAGARVAVQTEKSVEALMLYLAVLRAGYVYLPLNTAYQAAEIEYFIGNAEPSVVVCSGKNFGWVSRRSPSRPAPRTCSRSTKTAAAACSNAPRCTATATTPARKRADDLAAILYTSGTTGRSKGAMLTHGNLLSQRADAQGLLGLAADGDVLIHALPIFHVHGLFVASHGALLNGSKMIWFWRSSTPQAVVARLPEATRVHGRAHAVRAPARRARLRRARPAATCACSSPARRRC